ncbi:DNA recombination protein RmuC [uncultured Prochlorococcus sp.]|uniref:DNA recombination protein RmuC n=1 Tax=uncultured Prochlorococcus sp. TaxID=159733 RepID=UPI002582C792|nr:DNA recombination protein RmuC [uncultured Prochlorococcus sp.]
MNTEKEILLNKEEIKTLESKIKYDETLISKEGHNFTRIVYEHNQLREELVDFCQAPDLKKSMDVLINPKNDSVQLLRRNIVNVTRIYEGIDSSEWGKGQLVSRKKINWRFDAPYLTQEEGFLNSSACSLDIKHILDYVELLNFCEFDKEINLTNEKNVLYRTDCLIEGGNGHYIAIELDKNFKTFKRSIFEKDKNKKEEYLSEYAKGLKEQINQLSKLEYKKNNNKNNKFKLDNLILYIPNETALKNVLEIDPEIFEYALEKNIELTFPTTFLAITYYISFSLEPKGITQEFKRFEKIHNGLLDKKREEIESNKEKIDKLLKINFEYLKAPSYQIKVTLNHEENYVLEEIVNAKGSNKSSVLRQILMEYNGIYKERDALKISVEKLNLEKNFIQDKCMRDIREIEIKHELMQKDLETELKRQLLEVRHQRDVLVKEHRSDIENLQNELMRKTEHYQSQSTELKDEFERREELMYEAIKSIEESISNNNQTLKEDVIKSAVQVINPKNINEFGKIMELINQNILILCDTSSITNKDQQRFIDMVYGGVYGLKGKIKEISNKIFLYIPQNFDLIDDSEKS